MPPKVIAKPDRPSGVLPVNAAKRATANKASTARLKLEVRRLPPGLTLTEFEETLGDEWKLNNGKVDWREYRNGKLKSPGKVPEQSRCYLHLVNEGAVKDFEQRFLNVVFHDKAGTHKHNDLKGLPPTLGFAPNQRTPLGVKQRTDNRQGTIDQDPEFIAFLEAETQPVTKPAGVESTEKTEAEVLPAKTTPLIEDLREKKARKDKAAASKAEKKKAGKAEEEEAKKGGKAGATADVGKSGEKDGGAKTAQQQKVEQAAKEAAKVLNKQAASKAVLHQQPAKQAPNNTPAPAANRSKKTAVQSPKPQNATPIFSPGSNADNTTARSPAPQRGPPQRQRGNADGIKKMLQKDLGIRPKSAQPRAADATPPKTGQPAPASTSGATPQIQSQPQTQIPQLNNTQKSSTPAKVPSAPTTPATSSGASTTKAYLKHANPSQGMTEMLILQALTQYGELSNVTIDPRKGTAIAVFKDNEGLKKAMLAKRVPVAGGVVEVLEFRDRSGGAAGAGGNAHGGAKGGFRGGARGGRGGGGGGGRGGGVTGNGTAAVATSGGGGSPAPAPPPTS